MLVNNDRREDCGNGNNKLKNIWKSANVIWKHINISTFFQICSSDRRSISLQEINHTNFVICIFFWIISHIIM